jgi:hypothetical protein
VPDPTVSRRDSIRLPCSHVSIQPLCDPGRWVLPSTGSDPRISSVAFHAMAKLKRWCAYTPPMSVCSLSSSSVQDPRYSEFSRVPPISAEPLPLRTAWCPESLHPRAALPSWGRCLASPRQALPRLHRSYELMRQTYVLCPPSVYSGQSVQVATSPCCT